MKIMGLMVQRFWVLGSEVLGSGVLGSAQPPAKKTDGQIDEETQIKRISIKEYRMSNIELRHSIYSYLND